MIEKDMGPYYGLFLEESKKNLHKLNKYLLTLEQNPVNISLLNEIFRLVHTMKGMSAGIGFENIVNLTHSMEDILAGLLEGYIKVNTTIIKLLLACKDRLKLIIDELDYGAEIDNSDLIAAIHEITSKNHKKDVSLFMEDNLLPINTNDCTKLQPKPTIQVKVPVGLIFDRLPAMVNDIAKRLHKKVDFNIEGKDTEVSMELGIEINSLLIHLIRNAIDHGIELPRERVVKGKPPVGIVTVRTSYEGNNLIIEVEDDGAGFDIKKILARGVEKGLVTASQVESITDKEIINLVYYPGFSTSSYITDISGRGIGLDIVKAKIEAFKGEIMVDFKPGSGTRFKIMLPVTK